MADLEKYKNKIKIDETFVFIAFWIMNVSPMICSLF